MNNINTNNNDVNGYGIKTCTGRFECGGNRYFKENSPMGNYLTVNNLGLSQASNKLKPARFLDS